MPPKAKKKPAAKKEKASVHDLLMDLHAAISDEEIEGESDFIKPHLSNIRSSIESYVQARGQETA